MEQRVCIGKGAQADVYHDGAYAYKLFHRPESKAEAFFEAAITAQVAATGLPVAQVYGVFTHKSLPVIQMDYVEGTDMNRVLAAHPGQTERYLDELVSLQRTIHSKRPYLPTSVKAALAAKIGTAPGLCQCDVRRLRERLAALPEGDCLCHGDFHGGNVLYHQGRYTVIDWVDAAIGCPQADACRSYMIYALYAKTVAEQYLAAYCRQAQCSPQAVVAWLPVVAGARLCSAAPQERIQLMQWVQGEA